MKVHRIRVTSEQGYYAQCSLMALGAPVNGVCQVYTHPKKDFSLEQAQELRLRILGVGEFNPEKWSREGQVEAAKLFDK